MKYLILLLLLVGCASAPLTEDEVFDRAYAEADRKNMYVIWSESCIAQNGVVYSLDALSRWKHVPRKWDWDYDGEKERPSLGNSVVCMSEYEVREMARSLRL